MKRVAFAGLLGLAACGRARAPEIPMVLPEFTMTAVGATGESPFGRREMLGRAWVVDFVYTSCAGPCPLMTQRLARLGGRLPPEVGLLTVTVDPEGDTPERLRAYARAHGADLRRWVFLRGTLAQTYELLYGGFRLPLSLDPRSEPGARAIHSTRFALVDKKGAIRGFYDGLGDLDEDALARDARRLLEVDS